MDQIKTFETFCDSILKGRNVVIPDKTLPKPVRRQEFKDNCRTTVSDLSTIFLEEVKNRKTQAAKSNKAIPSNILEQFGQIGKQKIDAFIEKEKAKFTN